MGGRDDRSSASTSPPASSRGWRMNCATRTLPCRCTCSRSRIGVRPMRESWIVLLLLGLALAAIARGWSVARARRISRERLQLDLEAAESEGPAGDEPPPVQPFLTRHRSASWIAGGTVAALIYFAAGLKGSYAAMFAVVVGLLVHEVEEYLAGREGQRIEMQLADAIDLMVA